MFTLGPDLFDPSLMLMENYSGRYIRLPKSTAMDFRRECMRLKTFKKWPYRGIVGESKLAKNGFFYTGDMDVVKCAFCGIQIGYWEKGDDPATDHALWAPDCEFVRGVECGNVPLEAEKYEDYDDTPVGVPAYRAMGRTSLSFDVCGFMERNTLDMTPPPFHRMRSEIRPFSAPERAPDILESDFWKDLEHLGVSKTSGPVNPSYATYHSRLKSFKNWPEGHEPKPEALAEAGFYYGQMHDNTLCFYCGGGLKSWTANDDPWVEHARWFNKCGFVMMEKGEEFVKRVTAEKKALFPGEVARDITQEFSPAPISTLTSITKKKKKKKASAAAGSAAAAAAAAAAEAEESASAAAAAASASESASACACACASASASAPDPVTAVSAATEGKAKAEASANSTSSSRRSNAEVELCRICYAREREIVLLPCRHFVCCRKCAPSLNNCALCRKPFEATLRVYLS